MVNNINNMELAVLNTSGAETGRTVDLSDAVFGIEPNDHAIYLAVKQFMANQRQGTHKSKERADISGSTRKVKKQKGTGTARMGSIKSPILRGGGRAFGPRPRDYSFKLNKKLKHLARKSALSYKATEEAIKVVENFSIDNVKTADYLAILKNLAVDGTKTLMVLPSNDKNIYLSSRNIPKAKVIAAADLNTYDILNADKLVLVEGSLEVVSNF